MKIFNKALHQRLAKAEQLSTLKSHFIASISHELRTPMTAIIGFTQLALHEDMPADVRQYLQNIDSASTNLLAILQDVLDFSKLEAGHLSIAVTAFNMQNCLNAISTLFTSSAQQKGIAFTISSDINIPLELMGDTLRLQQVLTNLVGNAIKFTAQGSVKLIVTLQSINLSQVQLLFTVTDTGIGIAPENQAKLFKAYSQADASITQNYGGTGLGLVISKELVELMGGEISVLSDTNQGSSFSFALPFDINNTAISPTTQLKSTTHEVHSHPCANKFKGKHVLIVEDDSAALKLIEKTLAILGIETKLASNGEQALALVQQYDFDIVLMDIHMPIMSGIEVTERIRQQAQFADLVIIALSVGSDTLERNNCLTCGLNDFIAKPFNVAQLSAALEPWLSTSAANTLAK